MVSCAWDVPCTKSDWKAVEFVYIHQYEKFNIVFRNGWVKYKTHRAYSCAILLACLYKWEMDLAYWPWLFKATGKKMSRRSKRRPLKTDNCCFVIIPSTRTCVNQVSCSAELIEPQASQCFRAITKNQGNTLMTIAIMLSRFLSFFLCGKRVKRDNISSNMQLGSRIFSTTMIRLMLGYLYQFQWKFLLPEIVSLIYDLPLWRFNPTIFTNV